MTEHSRIEAKDYFGKYEVYIKFNEHPWRMKGCSHSRINNLSKEIFRAMANELSCDQMKIIWTRKMKKEVTK